MKNIKRKPQNSGNLVERDTRGKFVSGHQKLGGIKKGTKHFKTELDEILNRKAKGFKATYWELMLEKVAYKMAIEGDTALIREYWHQSDGKPIQALPEKDNDELEELSEKIRLWMEDAPGPKLIREEFKRRNGTNRRN